MANVFQMRNQLDETPNYPKPLNYSEVLEESKKLGQGIAAMNLAYHAKKEFRNLDLQFVGIRCKNKIEW